MVLGDASDEDEEPEELFPDSGKSAPIGSRESRKEREEKLRKMMEEEGTFCISALLQYSVTVPHRYQMKTKKCRMLRHHRKSRNPSTNLPRSRLNLKKKSRLEAVVAEAGAKL